MSQAPWVKLGIVDLQLTFGNSTANLNSFHKRNTLRAKLSTSSNDTNRLDSVVILSDLLVVLSDINTFSTAD